MPSDLGWPCEMSPPAEQWADAALACAHGHPAGSRIEKRKEHGAWWMTSQARWPNSEKKVYIIILFGHNIEAKHLKSGWMGPKLLMTWPEADAASATASASASAPGWIIRVSSGLLITFAFDKAPNLITARKHKRRKTFASHTNCHLALDLAAGNSSKLI